MIRSIDCDQAIKMEYKCLDEMCQFHSLNVEINIISYRPNGLYGKGNVLHTHIHTHSLTHSLIEVCANSRNKCEWSSINAMNN